ncbi:MAG: glycosyltransferase [Clostridium sp.]|nr:glycosyltransferase [Clostridium sp.]
MSQTDVSVNNLFGVETDLPSTQRLRRIVNRAKSRYIYLSLSPAPVSVTPEALARMADVARQTDAAMLYTDYRDLASGEDRRLSRWHRGCVRDSFDFGPGVLIDATAAAGALQTAGKGYEHAGFYDLWLRLSLVRGGIFHLPEVLAVRKGEPSVSTGQFDYQFESSREAETEREQAFTAYLRQIGALLSRDPRKVRVDEAAWPVVASVIIPVRNREKTIEESVRSALAQKTDFTFNILVVDNYSTDRTTEILVGLSKADPRVIRVTPRREGHGIGGCWNEAVNHRLCGAYAVQLDSDDLYSGEDTLEKIVGEFRAHGSAMVVGAYRLTTMDGTPLDPPVVDHREWTPSNGRNNLLRVNGIGAPRAYATEIVRRNPFPDVSYGEDYAAALRISRTFAVHRIFEPVYTCRRWEGNSDANLTPETAAAHDRYKDTLREIELSARIRLNASGK